MAPYYEYSNINSVIPWFSCIAGIIINDSFAFGLMFWTFLKLFMLPAALYAISDLRFSFKKNKDRRELEPVFKELLM